MELTRKILPIFIVVSCIVGGGLAGRFKVISSATSSASRTSTTSTSGSGTTSDWTATSESASESTVESESGGVSDRPGCTSGPNSKKQRPISPKLSTPQQCARRCKVGEPPRTCFYTFHIEYYATLTNACQLCMSNATTRLVDDCQCITADGYERAGLMTANRMYPGPSIVVCENDNVVIDIENHAGGAGVTIHWHGILQKGSQYYDGVPFVTQCPVQAGMTFRYLWTAANAGTHFWHSHTGLQKAAGLEGAIIVREPKESEPNSDLWDREELNHVIFVTDWSHSSPEDHFPGTLVRNPGQLPDNFLINGRGRFTDPVTGNRTSTPLSVFRVRAGLRYRFRLINASTYVCPATIIIQNHNFTVFSSDGEPVDPVTVTSITSFSAERFDFVIHADEPGDYWIQVRAGGPCESRQMQQLAILRSESEKMPARTENPEPTFEDGLDPGVVLNPLNVRCGPHKNISNVVCVSQLRSVEPVPPQILKKQSDYKYFMTFGFFTHNITDLFKPGTYKRFLVTGGQQFASLVSNISNVFPPSTLISQRDDNPEGQICSPNNLPKKCEDSKPCTCTHVNEIRKGAVVELILFDISRVPTLSHPFHLHGHAFHILGEGSAEDFNRTKIDVDFLKDLDRRGKLHRNMKRPPAKDTFALPNNGYTVVRFLADNPGYWLFHCHFLPHLADGMSTIFHTGTPEDLPPIPEGFPKCGNFIPKIRF